MNFEVQLDERADTTVVRVRGELDIATTPKLQVAVDGLAPGNPVEIDLTPTEFIDSTACRYFLHLSRRAGAAGRAVTFVCPEDNYEVWRVLELLGLLDALGIKHSDWE